MARRRSLRGERWPLSSTGEFYVSFGQQTNVPLWDVSAGVVKDSASFEASRDPCRVSNDANEKAHPPSGERVRPSSYAWPSLSWPANRVRQVPDARGVRRKRGVFTNFEASSDSRASRRRSA
jgi:hypothetical protein